MKVIEKNFSEHNQKVRNDISFEDERVTCCGDENLYSLDGWEDDWMCADCLLRELINNNYTILPENINNLFTCIKCGTHEDVHFRQSMRYLCDKCVMAGAE